MAAGVSVFKKLEEVLPHRKLKIGIWGPPEAGKTHFIMTCPPPVYIIDTEFGSPPLAKKFKGKDIRVIEVFREKPDGTVDPLESLKLVEQAIEEIKDCHEGTIAIDSGSDLWDWCEAYMRSQASSLGRELQQFDWRYANDKWKEIIMKCISRDMVFVLTAQPKERYLGPGMPSGIEVADWMKKTPFALDVVIRMEKRVFGPPIPIQLPPNPKPSMLAAIKDIEERTKYRATGQVKYIAVIEKCRAERMYNMEIEDLTYDKLIEVLRPYLWWIESPNISF
jgi:hypothetical protein